jgi:hypothetical protein
MSLSKVLSGLAVASAKCSYSRPRNESTKNRRQETPPSDLSADYDFEFLTAAKMHM